MSAPRKPVVHRVAIPGHEPCPRCAALMQVWERPPGWSPPTWRSFYFERFATCPQCRYVLNYETFKRPTQQVLSPSVAEPPSVDLNTRR
jgi:hypothetical protein